MKKRDPGSPDRGRGQAGFGVKECPTPETPSPGSALPSPPSPAEGRGAGRKPPRWTIAFLRALERGGEVRGAALDAGVDFTTAYARRKAHADFAAAWDSALRSFGAARESLRSGRAEEEERAAIEAIRTGGSLTLSGVAGLPSPAKGRGELFASTFLGGGQVKRAGHDRWSQAKEKIFFEELAATANVKRAAAAAGVSTAAVYARRMKQPLFRAKWVAVLETGRAAIEMKLVEAANKSFDPDDMDVGEVQPRVSVAEAIRIVQLHGSKAQQATIEDMESPAEEVAEIRERLIRKLRKLRERHMGEQLAEGWSFDDSWEQMIPPGWVKGPDWKPNPNPLP